MRAIAVFISVVAIGIVQLYVAGPLGLAWDLDRHAVALAAFLGGMIGVVALAPSRRANADDVRRALAAKSKSSYGAINL